MLRYRDLNYTENPPDAQGVVDLIRIIAGGTASHSEYARYILNAARDFLEGNASNYEIKSPAKLQKLAEQLGIATLNREDKEILTEVMKLGYADFGRYHDQPLAFLNAFITKGRSKKFRDTKVMPQAIDCSITEIIAQTVMGSDTNPVSIIYGGLKNALCDLGGSYIGTNISDILFGIPEPIVSEVNLEVINPKMVNIAIHGHCKLLGEVVVTAAQLMKEEAEKVGAEGINIVGICCTDNELLMREGVYLATSSISQEMAIMSGALDAMVVDIQCIFPSVQTVAECFHTKIVTTETIFKTSENQNFTLNADTALIDAKELVQIAINAYKQRDPNKINIPDERYKVVAGFSIETFTDIFSKVNPDRPISVLTDAILSGEIKGVALIVGCNNLTRFQDESYIAVLKELIKNDVLVITTGCSAGAFAKAGLMSPSNIDAYAGAGLKSFLKTLEAANPQLSTGLPLVFYVGSCIDNSRGMDLAIAMANELGVDIHQVPYVVSAPEAMHDKAAAIGAYAVTMGIPVHVGSMPHVESSDLAYGILTEIAQDIFGGNLIFEVDPIVGAKELLDALDYRTCKLSVHERATESNGTLLAKVGKMKRKLQS